MLRKLTCANGLRLGVVAASLLFAGTPFAQSVPENASGIFKLKKTVSGSRLLRGGNFCFEIVQASPNAGQPQHFKLAVAKARGNQSNKIVHIDALERGLQSANPPFPGYFNQLSGSATVAEPNDGLAGGMQMQIGLTGTSFGNNGDTARTGIWVIDYAIVLDPQTLNGTITGIKRFSPVQNGLIEETTTSAVQKDLKPMPCSQF
jgi:hypothetical protein